MKRVLALVPFLMLLGCVEEFPAEIVDDAKEICSARGGIDSIKIRFIRPWHSFICEDGLQVRFYDLMETHKYNK